jgi:outer membrane receptor for ferrienterochelin and colicins
MKQLLLCTALCLCLCYKLSAQTITGLVLDADAAGETPLIGAIVQVGKQATITDAAGRFIIKTNPGSTWIRVSYIGYKPDSIKISSITAGEVKISLHQQTLTQVTVSSASVTHSMLSTIQTEQIGMKEIRSAACCNLSETFNQNSSVDVVYPDAVTGAKEIKLLGLDGAYAQILLDNIPAIHGLNQTFGLQHIPGQWLKGIAVNKGSGSVINGYESTSGQLNVEEKQAAKSDLLFLNLFATQQGYVEGSADMSFRLSDYLSTMTLVHGEYHPLAVDYNKDGFADHPKYFNVNIKHKWHYDDQRTHSWDIAGQFIDEKRRGGELSYINHSPGEHYGIGIDTRRYELTAKNGFYLHGQNSLGIQYRFYRHETDAIFGMNTYSGKEHFGSINAIYQASVPDDKHLLKLGANFFFDDLREQFNGSSFQRLELVPGLFSEYTYKYKSKFSAVAGMRLDYNTAYHKAFFAPRVHLRYAPSETWTFRVSAGKGYRAPFLFAENLGLLASNRRIIIDPKLPYEEAWNYGISLVKNIYIARREMTITADYFRTDFLSQLVVDREEPTLLQFYALKGHSFSNSYQLEINYELLKGLNMKLAYRYDDVRLQTQSSFVRKALMPFYKGLANVNYVPKNGRWMFNLTGQLIGPARIPSTSAKEIKHQLPGLSKPYFQLNAQVNYSFKKKYELYVGAENILNYMQTPAILSAENPFGRDFDATLIYGPVDGIRAYIGFRYHLPYEKSKR